jgi:hypothetical protein
MTMCPDGGTFFRSDLALKLGILLPIFAVVTGSHYALLVITLARTWVERLMKLRVVSVYNERTSVLATPCKIMQKGTGPHYCDGVIRNGLCGRSPLHVDLRNQSSSIHQ